MSWCLHDSIQAGVILWPWEQLVGAATSSSGATIHSHHGGSLCHDDMLIGCIICTGDYAQDSVCNYTACLVPAGCIDCNWLASNLLVDEAVPDSWDCCSRQPAKLRFDFALRLLTQCYCGIMVNRPT